jgi:hypothetical protein
MSDVKDGDLIDATVAPAHQAESIKDRRRPGRIHNVSPALIPLLRAPTAGAVAGDLFPIDSLQIVALWAASAYPADVWRRMSKIERSAAISREMLEMEVANAALSSMGSAGRSSRLSTLSGPSRWQAIWHWARRVVRVDRP